MRAKVNGQSLSSTDYVLVMPFFYKIKEHIPKQNDILFIHQNGMLFNFLMNYFKLFYIVVCLIWLV